MADTFDPDKYLNEKTGVKSYSGFSPDNYLQEKTAHDPSMLETAGKALRSVTLGPVNAAISAVQTGGSPWQAAKSQFANMNQEAPSGEQIARQAGFSSAPGDYQYLNTPEGKRIISPATYVNNPDGTRTPVHGNSNSQIAGAVEEAVADPLNYAGPVLKGVGKVAEVVTGPVAKGLESFAAERALKAAGAMKKDFNLIHAKGMHDDLGKFLLDTKLVTPISTVSKVAERISEAKDAAGQTIGHILDTADAAKATPISARDIALHLSEDPDIMNLGKIPGHEKTANQINNYINTLYTNGDELTLREAQKLRQGIDESINFNKRVPEMSGAMPYLYKMRSEISKAMNGAVNSLPAGGELDRLREANKAYSKLSQLDKIAQNRLGALASNEQINLSDKLSAGVGAVTGGNPLSAIGMAGLSKASRSFGNSIAATGARGLSNAASIIPETISSSADLITPLRVGSSALKNLKDKNKNNVPGYSGGGTVVQRPTAPIQNIDPQKIKIAQESMRKAFGFASGGTIPGTPQIPIDSPKNDTTLIKATPGEVVLPLSVTQSSNPPKAAKEFMENEMGPDKWASDGFQNLRSHVGDEERKMLDEEVGKLMLHPKTKNLLITASKFQPGTQPLDQIFKHIKGHLGMEE